MGKRNPYRFSVKLDEDDADHQIVADYLNGLGRKKAKIIVKAVLAYLEIEKCGRAEGKEISEQRNDAEHLPAEKVPEEKTDRMIQLDMEAYSIDEAEIALMRRNYEKMGKG